MARQFIRATLLCSLAIISPAAMAFGWDDLWKRSDQQLRELLEQQAFEAAEDLASTSDQSALVKYRSGDFGEAAKMYGDGQLEYNKGTALVQAGEYEAAIEAYDQVLADNPEYTDAMHNRKIAQKLAEMQKQQQQQDGGEQNQDQESTDPSSQSEGQSGQNQDPSPDESKQGESESDGSDGQESQQQREQPSDSQAEDGEKRENEPSEPEPTVAESTDNKSHDEKRQAMDQWLQQVPDDPAGLLRARIIREHQRSYGGSQDQEQAW